MSAWIVSRDHLDLLLTAAQAWGITNAEHADDTGRMLWNENLAASPFATQVTATAIGPAQRTSVTGTSTPTASSHTRAPSTRKSLRQQQPPCRTSRASIPAGPPVTRAAG